MAQHEAATATGPLETLLQKVGDLRGGAGDGRGVARRRLQSVFEKILERDFAVIAQRTAAFGSLMHRIIESVAKQAQLTPVEPIARPTLAIGSAKTA